MSSSRLWIVFLIAACGPSAENATNGGGSSSTGDDETGRPPGLSGTSTSGDTSSSSESGSPATGESTGASSTDATTSGGSTTGDLDPSHCSSGSFQVVGGYKLVLPDWPSAAVDSTCTFEDYASGDVGAYTFTCDHPDGRLVDVILELNCWPSCEFTLSPGDQVRILQHVGDTSTAIAIRTGDGDLLLAGGAGEPTGFPDPPGFEPLEVTPRAERCPSNWPCAPGYIRPVELSDGESSWIFGDHTEGAIALRGIRYFAIVESSCVVDDGYSIQYLVYRS